MPGMRRAVAMALAVVATCAEVPAVASQDDPRLDALFHRLLAAASPAAAAPIEQEIWQIWIEWDDADVSRWMRRGVEALNGGDFRVALDVFDRIVEAAPEFSEGWNKRATLYYLAGHLEASVADVKRTLALEPRHFGALSGLALIRELQGRPFDALEALERVTKIHPQLPHLKQRIDLIERILDIFARRIFKI